MFISIGGDSLRREDRDAAYDGRLADHDGLVWGGTSKIQDLEGSDAWDGGL